MGHYDAQYEAQEREDEARAKREAQAESKRTKLGILKQSKFQALGICGSCSHKVYAIPNWGCSRMTCPHKP